MVYPAVPNLFSTSDRFRGRQFFLGGGGGVLRGGDAGVDCSSGNAMGSDGKLWEAADEASLASPPLISCCAARFLTGRGPQLVRGLGVGDP